jgi:hypothetical protein
MNMNAMLIRSSILMVVALVLAFTAVRQMPSAHAQSVGTHATTRAANDPHAPVLLPTVKVRPSAADMAEAQQADAELIEVTDGNVVYDTLSPNMPSLRMDMPYYSFGKVLRRGVKE